MPTARDLGLFGLFTMNLVPGGESFFDTEAIYIERHYISTAIKLHTYIHNWSLQPFSQDYDLVSYITYVVRVNFLHGWR